MGGRGEGRHDPDGTTDLATMVARANDDFGQAEPVRFATNAFAFWATRIPSSPVK